MELVPTSVSMHPKVVENFVFQRSHQAVLLPSIDVQADQISGLLLSFNDRLL